MNQGERDSGIRNMNGSDAKPIAAEGIPERKQFTILVYTVGACTIQYMPRRPLILTSSIARTKSRILLVTPPHRWLLSVIRTSVKVPDSRADSLGEICKRAMRLPAPRVERRSKSI